MVHKASRPTVHDIRAMKARGQKTSMLYVSTPEEAAAADAAGIDMLSIEGRFFTPEMREAAGRCFVQVGLPFGGCACRRLSRSRALCRHAGRRIPGLHVRARALTGAAGSSRGSAGRGAREPATEHPPP
jgi:ketopantoate hydroxymethyltransferase